MPLTSTITDYNPAWPTMYTEEVARLSPIFATARFEAHHVGSTSVPDLSAKPEIDILVLTDVQDVPEYWLTGFHELGYRRGGDLSQGHRFFKRDVGGVRTHKVHVCTPSHPTSLEMIAFRDRLRSDPWARAEYQSLKLALERENTQGISEYLARKRPFIEAITRDALRRA